MIRLGYNNLWRILEVYKKAPAECNCIPAGAFCYTSDVRDFNLCRRCAEFRSYHVPDSSSKYHPLPHHRTHRRQSLLIHQKHLPWQRRGRHSSTFRCHCFRLRTHCLRFIEVIIFLHFFDAAAFSAVCRDNVNGTVPPEGDTCMGNILHQCRMICK